MKKMKKLIKSIINRFFTSKVKVVENKDRKFGSSLEYYQVDIVWIDGANRNLLFTKDEIDDAMVRAYKNSEDLK
jgi:hypothetical protein